MNLEQFKFKKSLRIGFEEEAKQPTGKDCFVEIFKNKGTYTFVKTKHNVKGNPLFFPSKVKLEDYLKRKV